MAKLSNLLYRLEKNKHKLHIGHLCYTMEYYDCKVNLFFPNTVTFRNAYSVITNTLFRELAIETKEYYGVVEVH